MGVLLSYLRAKNKRQRKTCTLAESVIPSKRHPVADHHSNPYLFGQKAVHDKDQCSLQAAEDGEHICYNNGVLLKQEGSEHPHQTQYTCLGYSGHCESSGEETEEGRVEIRQRTESQK